MVGDADSGNGHRPTQPADDGTNAGSDAAQSPPSKLTQELAQLLAASIAQGQAKRQVTGAVPTNSELTSLASLVSAASTQRTLAPVFKDGLSALSYAPPPASVHGPATLPDLPDDEPMPIPSTWREPAVHDDQRWFRQQMGAAVLGLVAGLLIVVPTVLWLSGWIGGPKAGAPASTTAAALPGASKPSEIKTVRVQVRPVERPHETAAQYVTGSIDGRTAAAEPQPQPPPLQASTARIVDAHARSEDLLTLAMRRIGEGDVLAAREMLSMEEASGPGTITFALAETYDPNMLAAWGSRGVASDVARARALYRKALERGVTRAQARLDMLK